MNCYRLAHDLPSELRWALLPILVVAGLEASGQTRSRTATPPNRGSEMTIDVSEPRPLAAAVRMVESRHALVITYEDPVYVHGADLADVTAEVVKDLESFAPGEAPRVLVPRPGRIRATYPVSERTDMPLDPLASVQALVDAHASAGNPGRFRVIRAGGVLHVAPAEARNRSGAWRPHGSVLDTRISMQAEQEPLLEVVIGFCDRLSEKSGVSFQPGMVMLQNRPISITAVAQPARDVLLEILATTGGKYSWLALYDPIMETYFLSVHRVERSAR